MYFIKRLLDEGRRVLEQEAVQTFFFFFSGFQ